ncbi:MAG: sulfotransferase [Chloroflexi bacterium]|nr:sulfotransferase [Chloroflexota bacterium]
MIVFVTCVKHPENSYSYDKVWQLLNNTLYSVCSQKDTNFRVIVVCDKKLPLFHHQGLINKYTDFINVEFSSHGEDVLNSFENLGNLPAPLSDPEWWELENDHESSIEFYGISSPSFLMQMLEKLVGKSGIKKLRKIKHLVKLFLKGEQSSKQKSALDYFHIANVIINMGSKLIIGVEAAKKYAPEYVMLFDADDYVGNEISAYVNSHPGKNGWIMAHGYKMDKNRVAPSYKWASVCGTGNIFNYSLLMKYIGSNISVQSTQDELFKHVDSELLLTIGWHIRVRGYFEFRGDPLLEYPIRSVIHLIGHEESSEYTRKIIQGKSVDSYLKFAPKVDAVTLINSTLIGYFNILPVNSTKVFCLGFQKTGTTSVDWVLQDMGYQVAKAYKQIDGKFSRMLEKKDLSEIKRISELFDAFQDIPWFLYYKEFDRWYTESKFILTTRESKSWWNSFLRYFRTEYYPLFEYVYGFENPIGNKEALVKRFEQHNDAVLEYFKNRPDDLLVLEVGEENALEKVSHFLGKETSYKKMPHKNAVLSVPQKNIKSTLKKVIRKLRKLRIGSLIKFLTFSVPPIMIVGSRKSGTRQLLSFLSCHPNIHITSNLKLTYPKRHPVTPEADRLKDRIRPKTKNSLEAIDKKRLIFNLLSKPVLLTAKRWAGVSTLGVIAFQRILEQFGSNIRIINMVRDGRDVILEGDKKVMGKYVVNPERWVYDIRGGIEFEAHPQVLTVRYEDLVQDYEKTIRKICVFIGETDVAPFLNYPIGASKIEDGYWIGKWKQAQFSERVGQLLENPDAARYLRRYGYLD